MLAHILFNQRAERSNDLDLKRGIVNGLNLKRGMDFDRELLFKHNHVLVLCFRKTGQGGPVVRHAAMPCKSDAFAIHLRGESAVKNSLGSRVKSLVGPVNPTQKVRRYQWASFRQLRRPTHRRFL